MQALDDDHCSPACHDPDYLTTATNAAADAAGVVVSSAGSSKDDPEISSLEVCPPSPVAKPPKKKTKKQDTELITDPPVLPDSLLETFANAKKSALEDGTSVETDLERQRLLKHKLDQEEKDRKAQAKEEASRKQQQAAELALKKAQEKLEKAQAKAQAIQKKIDDKSCKRKLDSQFASVDDKTKEPASPDGKKPATRKRALKLSPKAKAFASSSVNKEASKDQRRHKAQSALQTLRDSNIPDLKLPGEDFNKKFLASSLSHACKIRK